MRWLYECGQLLDEIPEDLEPPPPPCHCGLNCEGRPLPDSNSEWLQISKWMGWRLDWREIYEAGDYPCPEEGWYDPAGEGIIGWWRDEGLGEHCLDYGALYGWQIIMRDHFT